MNDVRDLKIIGIDNTRPPKARKEPYIDLVFVLSEKARKEWCQDFNMLFTNSEYSVKIDSIDCLYIETWVRTMAEIPSHLEMLKEKVSECSQTFYNREIERAQAALTQSDSLAGEGGAQGLLNDIIGNLKFD